MQTSIVIPSMNRKERLLNCIGRILTTIEDTNDVEICVAIDEDRESFTAVASLVSAGHLTDNIRIVTGKISDNVSLVAVFNPERKGAIACWNQGLAQAKGDILVFFNDDCYPEPGWLDASMKAHKEVLHGYGLVAFNDGYQDGNKLGVQYLFDRQFCIDHLGGVMAYPVYNFYYNDTESNERAKIAGHFYWCKEAVVQHQHWTRPGFVGKMDSLDKENKPFADLDKVIFEQRKAYGFPNNFEPVLKGDTS